jgi:hypothetical protein
MRRRTMRSLIAAAGVCSAVIVLGGCGTEVLSNPEQDVSNAVFTATGQRPKTVTCPKNIDAKVGKTFRCTLTASDGTKIGATVTETSITNGKVQMHIQVDKQAES